MSLPARDLLATLRDLPGVMGSFAVTDDGRLLCHDMPAYFDQESMTEVGPRAGRIFETWSAAEIGAECVMRFEEHKLYLRTMGDWLLCAVLAQDVHLPSMRTAAGLVARKLGRVLNEEPVQLTPSAPAASSPAAADTQASSPDVAGPTLPAAESADDPPSERKRVRVYRGRRFEY